MTDENSSNKKHRISKLKVYSVALGIFLLINLAVETGITLLENSTHKWLYPIFPFTRIGILIIIILGANLYIRRREDKPKSKLWWRISKPILLIVVFFGLTIGAWLSVSQADADRAAAEAEKARQKINNLQVPTKSEINSIYGTN